MIFVLNVLYHHKSGHTNSQSLSVKESCWSFSNKSFWPVYLLFFFWCFTFVLLFKFYNRLFIGTRYITVMWQHAIIVTVGFHMWRVVYWLTKLYFKWNYGENVVLYLYMNELTYGGCRFYWAHTGPSGHGQLRSDLDRRHYFSQRSVYRVLHHRNPAENRELASTRRLWIHYSLTVMLSEEDYKCLGRGKLA